VPPFLTPQPPAIKCPAEIAAGVYQREPCARSFREDLEAHLRNGYVFSTPEYFVMGRVVSSSAPPEEIVDPWIRFAEADADAWLIYLLAGDVRKAFEVLPHPLPRIGWERSNALRFWPLAKFQRILLAKGPEVR
jgi:hypothetical protein